MKIIRIFEKLLVVVGSLAFFGESIIASDLSFDPQHTCMSGATIQSIQKRRINLFKIRHKIETEAEFEAQLNKIIPVELFGERFDVPHKNITHFVYPDGAEGPVRLRDAFTFEIEYPTGGASPLFTAVWGRRMVHSCTDPANISLRVRVDNPFLGSGIELRQHVEGSLQRTNSYKSPSRTWQNLNFANRWALRDYTGPRLTLSEEMGLIRGVRSGTETFSGHPSYFRGKAIDHRQIFISCGSTDLYKPKTFCEAHVFWPDGLGLRITHIPSQLLSEWDAMFEMVHEKLLEWHQLKQPEYR